MTRRYHPILVTLHWLLAALIIVMLVVGKTVLTATPNSDPSKLFALQMHMITGTVILVLMAIRLVVRLRTATPPRADIGNEMLNRGGVLVHWLLYLLVFAMVATGIGISALAGLPDIVFFGSGAPLPDNFDAYPPRAGHGLFSALLIGLILAHAAAAFYHHFGRRDGLLRRMWFGSRAG